MAESKLTVSQGWGQRERWVANGHKKTLGSNGNVHYPDTGSFVTIYGKTDPTADLKYMQLLRFQLHLNTVIKGKKNVPWGSF